MLGSYQCNRCPYGTIHVKTCVCFCGKLSILSHRLFYKWTWLTGEAGPSVGAAGILESCVRKRFAGTAVLAGVVKNGVSAWQSVRKNIYPHLCIYAHEPLWIMTPREAHHKSLKSMEEINMELKWHLTIYWSSSKAEDKHAGKHIDYRLEKRDIKYNNFTRWTLHKSLDFIVHVSFSYTEHCINNLMENPQIAPNLSCCLLMYRKLDTAGKTAGK